MKTLLVLVITLGLVGCGTPTATTPSPVTNSPQTQAHNINKTLADSINALVKTSIAMRDQGKLSAGNTKQIEDWSVSATLVSDKVEMEIASSDSWPVQKQKIIVLLTGFQIPNPNPTEATVQAALTAVKTVLTQLQAQVQ
jgi:hypothetical protein